MWGDRGHGEERIREADSAMLPPPHPRFLLAVAALALAACGSTTEPHPATIIVAPAADTLEPGTVRQLTARVVDLAGDTAAAEGVLWSSSAPDVAHVDQDGQVTATGFGSTTISALVADQRGAAEIRVQRPFLARTVVVGPRTACALDMAGQAWCFGDNSTGQLGLGNTGSPRSTLTSPVLGGHAFSTISVGDDAVCSLDAGGKAWCWGSAEFMGHVRTSSSIPVLADTLRAYESLSVGTLVCGISGGAPYCWGLGGFDLGRISSLFAESSGFTSMVVGYPRMCAVLPGVGARCWNDIYWPEQEFLGGAVAQVAVGGLFRCGRYVDGHALCDGKNESGELGNGTTTDADAPTPLPGTWTELTAGETSACGLATDGTALCWGANESGQLGTGDSTMSLIPVAVATSKKFRAISAASGRIDFHHTVHRTCAVTTSDELFCWGAGLPPRPAAMGY